MAAEPGNNVPLEARRISGARLAAGQIVDERYEVIDFIGTGGMSDVYRVHQVNLGKVVALKLLHRRYVGDDKAIERFKREAMVISSLDHANIVRVFGFGVWQNQPYLVMEHLEGVTLSEELQQHGRLSKTRALHIFDQILQALAQAHERGVVHRDLKPSNVLLLHDDTVKLLDFGIAKLLPESGKELQKLTQTSDVFGTPLYMSPEQCMGQAVDARSDIYSMGCLMYEVLTGAAPAQAETSFAVMHKHLNEPTPDSPWLDQSLSGPIMLCLEKNPADRPQSATAVLDMLFNNLAAPAPKKKTSSAAPKPGASKSATGSKSFLLACLAVVAAALGGGVFVAIHRQTPAAPVVEPQADQRYGAMVDHAIELRAQHQDAEATRLFRTVTATTDAANFENRLKAIDMMLAMVLESGQKTATLELSQQYFDECRKFQPNSREYQREANSRMIRCFDRLGDFKQERAWANRQLSWLGQSRRPEDRSPLDAVCVAEAFEAKARIERSDGDFNAAGQDYANAIGCFIQPGLIGAPLERFLGISDSYIMFLLERHKLRDARKIAKDIEPYRMDVVSPSPALCFTWARMNSAVGEHWRAIKWIDRATPGSGSHRSDMLAFRESELKAARVQANARAQKTK